MGKAEQTRSYILEKVAPYFNQHGYHGTSLSDITSVTGLSKGSIYGNFENKENLALEAFRFNVKRLMSKLNEQIEESATAYEKLTAITRFYRKYDHIAEEFGGCPVIKIGVDSLNDNPKLHAKVKNVIIKLKLGIQKIIDQGIASNELKPDTNSRYFANVMYSAIQGAVFTSFVLNDGSILNDAMDMLDSNIRQLKN